jgi:hypothetical protein
MHPFMNLMEVLVSAYFFIVENVSFMFLFFKMKYYEKNVIGAAACIT